MAIAGPCVGERESGNRDELPGVAVAAERELQDPRGAAVAHFAVRRRAAIEAVDADSARADGELPDADLEISAAIRPLRGEALVDFVVRVDHDLRPGGVEIIPQRPHGVVHRRQAVAGRGAEEGGVPHRERALRRVVQEVVLEPLLLGRALKGGDAAVEHHDVPIAQVVAVVELARIAGGGPEILPVRGGPGAEPFHVPDGGSGAVLVLSPGGAIAVVEVRRVATPTQDVVTDGEDGAGDGVEERRRGLVVLPIAARNVPGADEHLSHHGPHRRQHARPDRATGADRSVAATRWEQHRCRQGGGHGENGSGA